MALRISWDAIQARSTLYLLSAAVRRVTNLALLPLLVIWASPAEFSRYGLLLSAFSLGIPLLSLNSHISPSRLYFDYTDPDRRADLLATSLGGALVQSTVALTLAMLLFQGLGYADPVSMGSAVLQVGAILAILGSIILEHTLVLMKVQGEARIHGVTEVLQGSLLLLVYLVLHARVEDQVAALLGAHCFAVLAAAALGLTWAWPQVRGGRWSSSLRRRALAFSAPTVVHLATLWLVVSGGRWIGSIYVSLDDLALYTLLTLGISLVSMISRSLMQARLPEIGAAFAANRLDHGLEQIHKACGLAVIMVAVAYVVAFVLLPVTAPWLPPEYTPTPIVLGLALAASLLDILYLRSAQLLTALKRTGSQSVATITASALYLPLAVVATRRYGASGLLVATICGYGLQALSASAFAHLRLSAAQRDLSAEHPPR